MRINKYLAQHMGISRRQADELIKRGEVKRNGTVAELNNQVEEQDNIEVLMKMQWKNIGGTELKTAVIYKSIFTVTTREDEENRATIYERISPEYRSLKSAGRLDYMSEGLLVLSNDGDLIFRLTHPKNETKKVYLVSLIDPFDKKDIDLMKKGFELEGYNLNPVVVTDYDGKYEYLKLDSRKFWYYFTLTEGRNNQIRKMCMLLGKKVARLIRVEHGEFILTPELYEKKVLDIT
jgi:23S rRNA pseudouridine2605 synthase